jgi:hypothetical protein
VFDSIVHIKRIGVLIRNVCVELTENKGFRELLKLVLECGKIVNQGTLLGTTAGFKLDSLLDLKFIKTNNQKSGTMLNVVISYIRQKNPALLCFYNELPTLRAIRETTFDSLKSTLATIETEVEYLSNELKIAKEKTGHESHPLFLERFGNLGEHLVQKTRKLRDKTKQTEDLIRLTMMYYGEKYPEKSFEEFTKAIDSFVTDFILFSQQPQSLAEIPLEPLVVPLNDASKDLKEVIIVNSSE